MGGTREGGKLANQTIIERYGKDWRKVGARKGGLARTEATKRRGFASMSKERIQEIGSKGGTISKRNRLKEESTNATV